MIYPELNGVTSGGTDISTTRINRNKWTSDMNMTELMDVERIRGGVGLWCYTLLYTRLLGQ